MNRIFKRKLYEKMLQWKQERELNYLGWYL